MWLVDTISHKLQSDKHDPANAHYLRARIKRQRMCSASETWRCVVAAAMMRLVSVEATEVWNGPSVAFTKADFADWTQAKNQDRITPNVWLTRRNSQGLFNIRTESAFNSGFSPADTE